MIEGLEDHSDAIEDLYGEAIDQNRLYARYHGKIVEFAKDAIRGKRVDLTPLLPYLE
jgi:endonuclease-3 related protein